MAQSTRPGADSNSAADAGAVWRQWYDNAANVWTSALGGGKEAYLDPFGVYRQWLKSAEELQGRGEQATPKMDPVELWKEWSDAAAAMWRTAAGSTPVDPLGLTTQWLEMVGEAQAKMFSTETPPLDPLSFFREWYDKTSEMWSTVVSDVIGKEGFIESASRYLDSYTSYYRTLRQTAESQLHNMQMPTRSDVARVAGLVVALEEKVDQLADTFDQHEMAQPQPSTLDAVTALEARISDIERKLDTLLTAVERLAVDGEGRAQKVQDANGSQPARRTARTSAAPRAGAATRAAQRNETSARRRATSKKGPAA